MRLCRQLVRHSLICVLFKIRLTQIANSHDTISRDATNCEIGSNNVKNVRNVRNDRNVTNVMNVMNVKNVKNVRNVRNVMNAAGEKAGERVKKMRGLAH